MIPLIIRSMRLPPLYHSLKAALLTFHGYNLRSSSAVRCFGNWITQQNWQTVYDESLVNDKLSVFTNILSAAVDTFLPFRKVRVCSSVKPWITTKIKSLICNRQEALRANGRDSEVTKPIKIMCRLIVLLLRSHFTPAR